MARLSREELMLKVEEYKNDYVKFILEQGNIRAIGGLKKFKLFDFQKELIRKLEKNNFNIILKARQVGISTTTGAYLAIYAMFHPHSDILIIAINEEVAKELILKCKTFYNNLNEFFKPVITNPNNQESIKLGNGSRIMAGTCTNNAGRSLSCTFLVIDECAFIKNIDELWTSAYPTVSNGGNIVLLSTPNGEGNLFHTIWTAAESGDNEFIPTKIYWWQYPGRDEIWKNRTLANLGYNEKRFLQEFECNFDSSSSTVIDLPKINSILRKNQENNITVLSEFKTKGGYKYENLNIYESPIRDDLYLISCDTAEGINADASAFIIINVSKNRIIGDFNDKTIKERELKNILIDVGYTFNNALIILELRSTGATVANYVIDAKYPNIFWCDRRMIQFFDENDIIKLPNQYDIKDNNMIPGIATNSKNKIAMVQNMADIIFHDEIEIWSKKLLEQQKTFIQKSTNSGLPKYGASGRNNDDLVSACFIGLYIKKYIWKIMENNNVLSEQVMKHFTRSTTDMTNNILLSETMAMSPIYNAKALKKVTNPYKHSIFGDLRSALK